MKAAVVVLASLGIGTAHAGSKVLILVTDSTVTAIVLHTTQLIASQTSKNAPADGRGDLSPRRDSSVTYDSTHHTGGAKGV